jgi:hypothetical protein
MSNVQLSVVSRSNDNLNNKKQRCARARAVGFWQLTKGAVLHKLCEPTST